MITLFFMFSVAILVAAEIKQSRTPPPIIRNAEWKNGRDPMFIRLIGQDYMDKVYGKPVSIK